MPDAVWLLVDHLDRLTDAVYTLGRGAACASPIVPLEAALPGGGNGRQPSWRSLSSNAVIEYAFYEADAGRQAGA